MGANVTLCGPMHLIPKQIEKLGVTVNSNIDEVIDWADALNVLRIQRERMGIGIIPSVREYRQAFGITVERMRMHKTRKIQFDQCQNQFTTNFFH